MSDLTPLNPLRSAIGSQKIGLPNMYGTCFFAWSEYGDDFDVSGIYRVARIGGRKTQQRMEFYSYVITHTAPQNARRAKFSDAVSAWQALASDIKAKYNKRAIGRHFFGYHLFIKEYMRSS
jgi:hypothetical protein